MGRCPEALLAVRNRFAAKNPRGGHPLDPIPQNHVHGSASQGCRGNDFPCWEFEGETLKEKIKNFKKRWNFSETLTTNYL